MMGREIIIKNLRENVPNAMLMDQHYHKAVDLGSNIKYLEKMKGGLTGVIAKLDTGRPGPVIAFRSDIDALPITESKLHEHRPAREGWRSKNEGIMHACGHDVHMTIGLGIAEYLARNRDSLRGTFIMIFTPAEEGGKGCLSISKLPIISKIHYFFAYHILTMDLNGTNFIIPQMIFRFVEVYKVEFTKSKKNGKPKSGEKLKVEQNIISEVMEEDKEESIFELIHEKIKANATKPFKGDNALMAGCSAILNIKSIPRNPTGYSRVSMTDFHSGQVNPETPFTIFKNADPFGFLLIIRADNDEIGSYIKEKTLHVLESSAQLFDVSVSINIINNYSYPAWNSNDPFLMDLIATTWKEMQNDETIIRHPFGELGSDDCIYIMKNILQYHGKPIYTGLVSDNHGGAFTEIHTPRFDIDDSILQMGVDLIINCIKKILTDFQKKSTHVT